MKKLQSKEVVYIPVGIKFDPIENQLVNELEQLRSQNNRLKAYMEKSGSWADLKDIEKWKPFDFYHYFCSLYQKKYRKEYRMSGEKIHNYQRIETFMKVNKIDNSTYKDFIDRAFSRYFSNGSIPNLGHIVSAMLYANLMRVHVKNTKTQDWFDIDQMIQQENEKFEEALSSSCDYSFIDSQLKKENALIEQVMQSTHF